VAAKDLLQRFSHHHLTMSFDVRRMTTGEHWEATVHKMDRRPQLDAQGQSKKPSLKRAETDFAHRKLTLYDIDIEPHRASRYEHDPKAQKNFSVTAHEFGHALGYSNPLGKGEESLRGHRRFEDVKSIMNIGRRLRARHLFLIMKTLGSMVPACTFTARVEP
jgi:hypothetical protein